MGMISFSFRTGMRGTRSFKPGCITRLQIIAHLNEPVSWGCGGWCTSEKRPAELLELAETDYGRMNDAYRLDFAGWQTSCSLKCERFKELFERSTVAMSGESALLSWALLESLGTKFNFRSRGCAVGRFKPPYCEQ